VVQDQDEKGLLRNDQFIRRADVLSSFHVVIYLGVGVPVI